MAFILKANEAREIVKKAKLLRDGKNIKLALTVLSLRIKIHAYNCENSLTYPFKYLETILNPGQKQYILKHMEKQGYKIEIFDNVITISW